MHKAGLSEIFALLPEQAQGNALICALELLFARGEWPQINDLHEQVMRLKGHDQFRAQALAIQIKAAIRLRQFDLAFEWYCLLLELGQSDKNICLQVETLWQMAIQILPARADKLSSLWMLFLAADMPNDGLQLWAKTGNLLVEAFAKNQAEARARQIIEAMREKLPEPFWSVAAQKLKK